MNTKDIEQLETQARFWNKVKIIPESQSRSCWEWQGATMENGYGVASIGKSKTQLAHRYAASLTQDISNKIVQHICDNKLCVRPSHLRIGSQLDNMRDMYVKNRQNSKVNIEIVRDIRLKSLTRIEYAEKYNISEHTVGDIQRRTTWAWVE